MSKRITAALLFLFTTTLFAQSESGSVRNTKAQFDTIKSFDGTGAPLFPNGAKATLFKTASDGTLAISVDDRYLYAANGNPTMDWTYGDLYDPAGGGNQSLDFHLRRLFDGNGILTMDYSADGLVEAKHSFKIDEILQLPATTATTGIIKSGSNNLLHTYGANNAFFGVNAGTLTSTGSGSNVGIGYLNMGGMTTAAHNASVGTLAGPYQGGNNNAILGAEAAGGLTGNSNVAVGYRAMQNVGLIYSNIAIGQSAFRDGGSNSNIMLGQDTGALLTGGNGSNTFIGFNTGGGITSGSYNTILGASVNGLSNLSNNIILADGQGNIRAQNDGTNWNLVGKVGVGTSAPAEKLDVVGSIQIPTTTSTDGQIKQNGSAILHTFGTVNTFLGTSAGNLTLTTAEENTGLGALSLQSLTTGYYNTSAGWSALKNVTTGNSNSALGAQSGLGITSGSNNVAIGPAALLTNSTADYNTAVGRGALNAATGQQNTAIGGLALVGQTTGEFNVAIGMNSGGTNTTGSNNTLIGYAANVGSSALSNATAIGSGAIVSASNSLVLGSSTNVGIGTSAPAAKLDVVGDTSFSAGIRINTTTGKPTCDVTKRGTLWIDQGGTGVTDELFTCLKAAADTYSWRSITTGG